MAGVVLLYFYLSFSTGSTFSAMSPILFWLQSYITGHFCKIHKYMLFNICQGQQVEKDLKF